MPARRVHPPMVTASTSPAESSRSTMTVAFVALDAAFSRLGRSMRTSRGSGSAMSCLNIQSGARRRRSADAGVLESAYRPGLEPGARKSLGVRVPPPALPAGGGLLDEPGVGFGMAWRGHGAAGALAPVRGVRRATIAHERRQRLEPSAGALVTLRSHCYVEEMVRFYLHEEPMLSSVPTHDLAAPDELARARDRLDEIVVKPRFGHGAEGWSWLL